MTARVPPRALGVVAVVVAALHVGVLGSWPTPPRPPVEAAAAPMQVRQVPAAALKQPAQPPAPQRASTTDRPAAGIPAPARSSPGATPPPAPPHDAVATTAADAAGPGATRAPEGRDAEPARLAADPPSPSAAPPLYPTRLPPSFEWIYQVQRGAASGTAVLRWAHEDDGFDVAMQADVAGLTVLDWTSRGRIDTHGLAPDRFAVRRQGREVHAANFQREKRVITYAGPTVSWPLPDGAQDRLSWMIQLAAIVDADPQRQAPGAEVVLFVTGARGDAAAWSFIVVGAQAVGLPTGPVSALRMTRRPGGPRPVQADVWLDPQRHHRPVKALLTAADGGEPLQLLLQAAP